MVGYLALGAALAIGLYLIARGMTGATRAQVMQWLGGSVGVAAALITVFFAVTGRPQLAIFPLLAALAMLMLWLGGRSRAASQANISKIETPLLRLELDHATGAVTGDILDGPLIGRRIESLGLEELLDLYRFCLARDDQSARLVEAFLDRAEPTWRDRARGAGGGTSGAAQSPMSESEALATLGLAPGASPDAIRAAHRRLMQQHHPDRGGSAETAARLNRAREILLGE
jgi:hypothetical protein